MNLSKYFRPGYWIEADQNHRGNEAKTVNQTDTEPREQPVAYERPVSAPPRVDDAKTFCPHCGGPAPTDRELIQALIRLLNPRATDIIPEMYRRLFTAAPSLLPLFERESPDLIIWSEDQDGNQFWEINPRAAQVARLFGAVGSLAEHFEPRNPDALDKLAQALQYHGGKHMRWSPPPSIAEYGVVVDVLLSVFEDFAGTAWNTHVAGALTRACWFLVGQMLVGQATTDVSLINVQPRPE